MTLLDLTEAPALPRAVAASSARWLSAAALCLAALAAFLCFGYRYLPLVDLPQHAAALSAWVHLSDPQFGFAEQFEINWTTPYLLGYLLAWPFVPWLGALGALKVVVFTSILATVGAYALLARAVRQDAWLCLLGFPLSLSFSFHFGFINFLLSTPLLVAVPVLGLTYARDPRWQKGVALVGALLFTCLTHIIAFALGLLVAFALCWGPRRSLRERLRTFWPFALLGLVFAPWLPGFLRSGESSSTPEDWRLGMYRVWDLPAQLLSVGRADELAAYFGIGILALVLLSLGRPSWSWPRWVLLASALLLYFFFPFKLRGVSFLYQRFAAAVIPGAILLAEGQRALLPKWPRRILMGAVAAAWLGLFVRRVHIFNEEARGFDAVVRDMPPRMRVRPIIFERASAAVPGSVPFLHFPAYYQAAKGGYLGYSFARYYTTFVRYRPGVDTGMAEDAEWNPQWFDARRELPQYDYFIVRAGRDMRAQLFGQLAERVALTHHEGRWWSYRAVAGK